MNRPTLAECLNLRRDLPPLLAVNLVIALLLTLTNNGETFAENLLFSNCIGGSILVLHAALQYFWPQSQTNYWRSLAVLPLGIASGFAVASLFGAPNVLAMLASGSARAWSQLQTTFLVGLVACVFFITLYRVYNTRTELEITRRRAAELQQAETAARLAMLQAQIEPHFLFNTLATVRSLISMDASRAEYTLDQLNDYLRASLTRTRKPGTTLADELALIHPLLEIARIRMGERLSYRINIPASLLATPLPPLLLQPLVENALEHGIEPAIHGGTLDIAANLDGDLLQLTVADSGMGLGQGNPDGVGLANVRQRLAAIYGERARLALYPNQPQGVIARLQIPMQGDTP